LAIRAWLRYDVVRRILEEIAPRTVLEIGCGQGSVGTRIAATADYLGVEPDEASYAVASARIREQGGSVIRGTHADVPAGSDFDLVCAFEVLEHIEHDRQMLEEWIGLVRPGGTLLLSVPAFADRFGPMDQYVGHFRRYEPDQLRSLLEEAGLINVRVVVYGWPLGYALERVRNRIDDRKLRSAGGRSMEDLTAASGRVFQPKGAAAGSAVAVATMPWRLVQRLRPDRGTGLVARATRPV
jgi:SAM-dependent methyltransferase